MCLASIQSHSKFKLGLLCDKVMCVLLLQGLVTGTIKGVVGTVTKPVTGVLDFASETASAVRDTSKGSSRKLPGKMRRPRCSYGPGGLLPAYSEHHAKAQHSLFLLNNHAYDEM